MYLFIAGHIYFTTFPYIGFNLIAIERALL